VRRTLLSFAGAKESSRCTSDVPMAGPVNGGRPVPKLSLFARVLLGSQLQGPALGIVEVSFLYR
jgi:hypothetical protein